jgi:Nuclear RNA-splicing-associated protein
MAVAEDLPVTTIGRSGESITRRGLAARTERDDIASIRQAPLLSVAARIVARMMKAAMSEGDENDTIRNLKKDGRVGAEKIPQIWIPIKMYPYRKSTIPALKSICRVNKTKTFRQTLPAKQQKMTAIGREKAEQYDAEQSKIREVYDEESGRYRLVRGSGEIIERIVSQADHARINQAATKGDGASYARNIFHQASRRI